MGGFLTGCVAAIILSAAAWFVYNAASVSAIEGADNSSLLVGDEEKDLSENETLPTQ